MYYQVVKGYIVVFGPRHKSTLVSIHNLANVHKALKDFETSSKLFEEIIRIRRGDPATDSTDLALSLMQAAGSYREVDQFEKAVRSIDEAYELLGNKYGEKNVLVAICLNNYGLILKKEKRYQQAEEKFVKALRTMEELLAATHPELISVKHNMGELYYAMGNHEKSQELLEETMNLIKKSEES